MEAAHNADIVIAYETFGRPDEAPLLLISGTGAQMLIWPEDFCTALAGRGFHVARFDNRDTGLSTHLTGTPAPSWLKAMLRPSAAPYQLDMAEGALGGQSSGRAAKLRLVFLYHPIPDMGFFHRPFMSFKALSCASSPLVTISFRCLSCAFITSSAVFPWSVKSHGPPSCLHVIVFIRLVSFHSFRPLTRTSRIRAEISCQRLTVPSV